MESSIIMMLLLQVVLILLNAVFACAEIAIISVNDNKMAKLAEEGNKKAELLVKMNAEPARFLATIQVAITLSGFLASAFAAENFSDPLVAWLLRVGVTVPEQILDTIVVIVITVILSYFTLVFGELVPKQLAMRKAEQLAMGIAGTINVLSKVFGPLVSALTVSTNLVLRMFGVDPAAEEEKVGEEEIRLMVEIGSEKGTIDHEEREFIQNVFEFDDLTAEELVTHRTDVVMLDLDDSVEEWERTIFHTRHTLYPVYEGSADHIVGILNTKDYFRTNKNTKEQVIREAMVPAYFVPDTVKADILFRNMKKERKVMAVVLDEYGGMTGIITMNDLVESLVGDLVNDTQEKEEILIRAIGEDTWEIHGSALLSDICQITGIKMQEEEYDTLNGLIFHLLGNIPEDGNELKVSTDELDVTVTKIRNHKVETAVVKKKQKVNQTKQEKCQIYD